MELIGWDSWGESQQSYNSDQNVTFRFNNVNGTAFGFTPAGWPSTKDGVYSVDYFYRYVLVAKQDPDTHLVNFHTVVGSGTVGVDDALSLGPAVVTGITGFAAFQYRTLKLEVSSGVVQFYIDDQSYYTFPETYTIGDQRSFSAGFIQPGGYLDVLSYEGVNVEPEVVDGLGGNTEIPLLTALGFDSASIPSNGNSASTQLPILLALGYDVIPTVRGSATVQLPALTSFGADAPIENWGTPNLPKLLMFGGKWVYDPITGGGNTYLPHMNAAGLDIFDGFYGYESYLPNLQAFGYDLNYPHGAEYGGNPALEPLTAFGYDSTYPTADNYAHTTIPKLTVVGNQTGVNSPFDVFASTYLPPLRAVGWALEVVNSATELPYLYASGGVSAKTPAALPALLCNGSDEFIAWGFTELPALKAKLPPIVISQLSWADTNLPRFYVNAHGLLGIHGTASITMPELSALGANYEYDYGTPFIPKLVAYGYEEGDFTGRMYSSIRAAAQVSGPEIQLEFILAAASALADYTPQYVFDDALLMAATASMTWLESADESGLIMGLLAVTDELTDGSPDAAWVTNTETQASSRYKNFPMTGFARIGSRYFGSTSSGIFVLEGRTDDEAPIEWTMDFGLQDFESPQMKRTSAAYVDVQSDGELTLTVTPPESDEGYAYNPRRTDNYMKQQRFDLGKGLRGNYFGVKLQGEDSATELNDLEFDIAETPRRI